MKMKSNPEETHKIWHAFREYLTQQYVDSRGDFGPSQMIGDEAIEYVEAYAKEHPEIEIYGCDDNHHASSILVVVPHPEMGFTVFFIPQGTGINNTFFLYPDHLKHFVQGLRKAKRKYIHTIMGMPTWQFYIYMTWYSVRRFFRRKSNART